MTRREFIKTTGLVTAGAACTGLGDAIGSRHDLVGKLPGQPWWRLWGLDSAKTSDTTFTIGTDTPEVVNGKITLSDRPGIGVVSKRNHLNLLRKVSREDTVVVKYSYLADRS